ncbi:MAG: hypothetical protein Q4C13_01370 [Clostridia bacterium]|nr:hypothetical protein [Clostridia bacterium]
MRRRLTAACLTAALTLLGLCLVCACGPGGQPEAEATPGPARLDLSDSGLTDADTARLQEYHSLRWLDLRGNEISAAAYDALAAALPDCVIRWDVPIAGKRVEDDASYMQADSFSEADVEALAYFASLRCLDARGCTDYEALLAAQARYPDLSVLWTVELGPLSLRSDARSLRLSEDCPDADTLLAALRLLPALETADLRGAPLSDADKLRLRDACPAVVFGWEVEILPGRFADSECGTLDLSDTPVTDVDALMERLRLFFGLTELDMCECGVSDEDMLRIRAAFPETKVVWMVDVGGYRIRTDIRGFSTGVITRFPDGGGYRTGDGGHGQRDGDFDKLAYCTDIVALDIGHCTRITDISFIAEMPKLQYLIIAMTGVTDLSPLAGQTELIYLEIFDLVELDDITPIKNCKNLRYLNCSATAFTEIDTLLGFTQLERLWITASALTDEQLAALAEGLPNTWINASRDRYDADHYWRRGNWAYVDMQRIYGMRAQFQYGVTPTPEPAATPAPTD